MPAPVFLRCLGVPELRGPNGEPIRFRTRKHLALLVFLSVEPRVRHRRERLADLLWPDASPAEGRHSLATALSVIRAKVGIRTFETSRDTVRLLAPDLSVDLERLARGEVLGDDTTPPLEVGGFLDEFEVGKSPEFMLWRDLQRARWFPSIRQAFIVLMDRCRRTGDFTRIEPLADRLLVLDDLSEDAIRAKMEGRAFAGDRLSSIRIFQAWRQRLAEELGATPSPLVEGMALRLRQRGYEPPGTSHIPTVHTEQWRDRAFIGRGPQYRVAYEAWESTNRSAGRHVLLLGDSGIGKTTLAERLVTAAGLEGAVSSRVQCYEVEREIPYAALGTVVRGLLDQPGASATSPEWLAELARCIPAVGHRYPHLPPARESEGETARLRLTEGVHQLLTAVAEEHPVILVVDDVHLADDASVAVFHLLMRRTQEQRIMIVLSARQAELARSPHASRLMDSRVPLGLTPIELPLLTDDEMNEVVSSLARAVDTTAPPAVRRALVRAAAGIPMVVELLFDDWRNHGDQCLALSVGAMTTETLREASTEVYEQLLDRVFRGLSPEGRTVLNLAAILGERLNDLGMYQLVDLSLGRTLTGMAELTQQRILRDGGRDLEFRNELLRAYAYINVPSPLRRALHGLIADRLIAAEADGESVPGLMLAWHCYRSGREEAAAPYLLRGSVEAIDRGAPFETELAIGSALPRLSEGHRLEATLILVDALQEQGRMRESLPLLEACNGMNEDQRTRVQIAVADGTLERTTSLEEAELRSQQLVALVSSSAEESLQANALQAVARQLVSFPEIPIALKVMDLSRELYERSTSLKCRVKALSTLLLTQHIAAPHDGLRELILSGDEVARACEARGLANRAVFGLHITVACACCAIGDYAGFLRYSTDAWRLSRKIGNESLGMHAAVNACIACGRLGRYQDQRTWAAQITNSPPTENDAWRKAQAQIYDAWALSMLGENQKAIEQASRIAGLDSIELVPWRLQALMLRQADVYFVAGQEGAAMNWAEEAFQRFGKKPLNRGYSGTIARWVAIMSRFSNSSSEALQTLEELAERIDQVDAIDQAEITCARLTVYSKAGRDWPEGRSQLLRILAILPEPVGRELRRLGVLA